jgi:Sulfotransferase domain
MTIKVIGAGFGRTGTSSLKDALEELGFHKCYHMREIIDQPQHAKIWRAAAKGKPVDWDALFQGYQATVDWPGCTFYRELMQRYPDAKVLLSVRDPERWHASAMNTIYWIRQNSLLAQLRRFMPGMRDITIMLDDIVWDGTFHDRFADKPYAMAVFRQHNEEVKRVVPPERLLVYDVKDGWEPLCRFLGVPVPSDRPFPHTNDTAAFQQMIQQRIQSVRRVAFGILAAMALFGGWLMLKRLRRSRE